MLTQVPRKLTTSLLTRYSKSINAAHRSVANLIHNQKQARYLTPSYCVGNKSFTKFLASPSSQHHCLSLGASARKMSCTQESGLADTTAKKREGKIVLTDQEWRAKLTPEEYSVCRKHGTERAFTGALLGNKGKGIYTCTCCGTEMFHSSAKFDSGSGWPSFFDVLKDKHNSSLPAVNIRQDTSYGMTRTEVLCGKCDAHLGHVFSDGPQPTGLRYCINSVCLKFKPDNQKSDL